MANNYGRRDCKKLKNGFFWTKNTYQNSKTNYPVLKMHTAAEIAALIKVELGVVGAVSFERISVAGWTD
jgi:hypothetical protein